MIALQNRTAPPVHMLYKSECAGREPHMTEGIVEGHVVKDFKLGGTRIKICDDYCRDKTPEAVQATLDRIALKTQSQFIMQEILSQPHMEQEA